MKKVPILIEVTRRPQALRRTPILLAVTPLPSPLTTPPVTSTYFIFFLFPETHRQSGWVPGRERQEETVCVTQRAKEKSQKP